MKPLNYFIHIPKTAGKTLKYLVEQRYQPNTEVFFVYDKKSNTEGFEHMGSLKLVMGHFRYGYHKFSNRSHRYHTFMRDPIDQVLSHYYYMKDHPAEFSAFDPEKTDLIEFAKGDYGYNFQTRFISGLDNMSAEPHTVLAQAKENLKDFYFVGITEQFDASLIMLAESLGWKRYFYKKRNIGTAKALHPKPDEDILDQLRQILKYDIELYSYALERFKKQKANFPNLEKKVRTFRTKNKWFWAMNSYYVKLKRLFGIQQKSLLKNTFL